MTTNHLRFGLLGLALCIFPHIVQAMECASVYINSTRDILSDQKQQSELSYKFNQHCQKNGEINKSSLSLGLDAVVNLIPFKFSAGSTSSQSKLEEFCKIGVTNDSIWSRSERSSSTVVVAALTRFNECLALENKGLRITHQEQVPRSVHIFFELTNNYTDASITAISFDPTAVTCNSTGFSKSGRAERIVDGNQALKIYKNLTLVCNRYSGDTKKGLSYPRTSIGVSTSLGTYTIDLTDEKLFGFTLANEAKRNYDEASNQRDRAIAEARANRELTLRLKAQLDGIEVELHTVSYGELNAESTHFFQPRLGCNADIKNYIRGQCGDKTSILKDLGSHAGDQCGYAHYVFACVRK